MRDHGMKCLTIDVHFDLCVVHTEQLVKGIGGISADPATTTENIDKIRLPSPPFQRLWLLSALFPSYHIYRPEGGWYGLCSIFLLLAIRVDNPQVDEVEQRLGNVAGALRSGEAVALIPGQLAVHQVCLVVQRVRAPDWRVKPAAWESSGSAEDV